VSNPPSNTTVAKAEIRALMRNRLREKSAEEAARASERACQRLESQGVWREASSILFYAPLVGELDVVPLWERALRAGKKVLLPRFDPDRNSYMACEIRILASDLVAGNFGIREPGSHCAALPLKHLDLVLVPGVAFDDRGRRLGRGRGYYDRLLADVRGIKCGMAFDEQIMVQIPVEPHDIILDCIVTPRCWLDFCQHRHEDDLVG
jgi:5-formyltetrahydrofolate cyclo-ligase